MPYQNTVSIIDSRIILGYMFRIGGTDCYNIALVLSLGIIESGIDSLVSKYVIPSPVNEINCRDCWDLSSRAKLKEGVAFNIRDEMHA